MALGDGGGGGGGGQLEDPVTEALRRHGGAGAGGGAAVENLHPPVHQVVVGVDALLAVGLVVLAVELKLEAAQGVDLLNGDLGALVGGDAVLGGGAGEGADAADLNGSGGPAATAGRQGQGHRKGQQQCKKFLLHTSILLLSKHWAPPGRRR